MDRSLHIPKPCHENWENMSPDEKGRHCAVCCKVVMDFTQMPTEKVVEYVASRSSENICGRFRSDQVKVPSFPEKNRSYTGKLKVFLAALYFVFGAALFSSCHSRRKFQHYQGEVRVFDWKDPSAGFKPMLDTPKKSTTNNHVQGTAFLDRVDTMPQNDSPENPK